MSENFESASTCSIIFARNMLKIIIGKSVGVNLQVRLFIICNADQLRESNLECFVLLSNMQEIFD